MAETSSQPNGEKSRNRRIAQKGLTFLFGTFLWKDGSQATKYRKGRDSKAEMSWGLCFVPIPSEMVSGRTRGESEIIGDRQNDATRLIIFLSNSAQGDGTHGAVGEGVNPRALCRGVFRESWTPKENILPMGCVCEMTTADGESSSKAQSEGILTVPLGELCLLESSSLWRAKVYLMDTTIERG